MKNKKDRNLIYKKCLELLESKGHPSEHHLAFLCNLIFHCAGMGNGSMLSESRAKFVSYFEEFILFNPKNVSTLWWINVSYNSNEVRDHQKMIIEFCIAMTE